MKNNKIIVLGIILILIYYLLYFIKFDVFYYILPEKLFIFLHSFGGQNIKINISEEFSIDNRKDHQKLIPKNFIQTIKKLETTNRHLEKIRSFKKQHPDFHHIIYDDDNMLIFMNSQNTIIKKAFNKLTQGAMKADLFRLVYLYQYGGFYFDADCHISNKIPFSEEDDLIIFRAETHIIQWCIISKKGHPIIKLAIEKACNNILNDSPEIDSRYPEPLAAGYAGPVVLGKSIEEILGAKIDKDINMTLPQDSSRKIKLINFRKTKGINHKYPGYESDMLLMNAKRWKANKM